MRQVKEDHLGALGELFNLHHAQIHAYCARMTGSSDTADDLTQEVFLRLYRYRGSYRGEAQPSTWLRRIAHNVCVDHFREAKRIQDGRSEKSGEDGPDRHPGPATVAGEGRAGLIRQALEMLPPDHRTVLILSRFHDMRYSEIADVLEVSESAVKVRVHRALKQLRKHYEMLERGHG